MNEQLEIVVYILMGITTGMVGTTACDYAKRFYADYTSSRYDQSISKLPADQRLLCETLIEQQQKEHLSH